MSLFDLENDIILIPEITSTPSSSQLASSGSAESKFMLPPSASTFVQAQPPGSLSSSQQLGASLDVPVLEDDYVFPEDATIIDFAGVTKAEFAAAKELDRRVYHEKLEVAVVRPVQDEDEFLPFFIQPHSYIHYTKWADDVNEDDDKVDYEVDSDDEEWISNLNTRIFASCIAEVCKDNGITYDVVYGPENSITFWTRRKAGALPHIRFNTIKPTEAVEADDHASDQTKYGTSSPSSSVSTTPVTTLDSMEGVTTTTALPTTEQPVSTEAQDEPPNVVEEPESVAPAAATAAAIVATLEPPSFPIPIPTLAFDQRKQRRLEMQVSDLYRRRKLSESDFEFVLDVFEKQAFVLKSTIIIPEENDEDQVCSVCLDGTSDDTNQILFCDGCNVAVHQNCYGVRLIPEGEWHCNRCQDADKSGKSLTDALTSVLCEFCGRPGGAMKRTTKPNEWAHVQCALWLPETELDVHCAGLVKYVCDIPEDRLELRCYICNRRRGAPIQCADPECVQAFHVTCAQDKRLCLSKVEREEDEEVFIEYNAWCGKHTPNDYRFKRAELLADDKSRTKKTEEKQNQARRKKRKSSASAPSTPLSITTRSTAHSSTPSRRTSARRESLQAKSYTEPDDLPLNSKGMVTRSKSPYFTRSSQGPSHRGDKRRKLSEDFAAPVDANGSLDYAPVSAPATPKQKKAAAQALSVSAPVTPLIKPEPTTKFSPPLSNSKRGRIQPVLLSKELPPVPTLPPVAQSEPQIEIKPEKQEEFIESKLEDELPPAKLIPIKDSPTTPAESSLLPPTPNSPRKLEQITLPHGSPIAALLFFNNDGSKDPEFGNELTESMAHDTLVYCWGLTLREARRRLSSVTYAAAPKVGEMVRNYRAPPKFLPGVLFEMYKYWFDKRRRRRGAPLLKKFAPSLSRKEAPKKLTDVSTRELVSTYRQLRMMRTHVERIRLVLEVTRKRERLKRELMRLNVEEFELLNLPEMANMRYLLDFFRNADSNGFFALPVSTEIAPTYYDIIKNPMDFRTMEDKLNTFQYYGSDTDPDSTDEGRNKFLADLRLITHNAMMFNSPDTVYYQEAQRLDQLITEVLQGEYTPPTPPPEPVEQDHVSDVVAAAQDSSFSSFGAGILSESGAQVLINGLMSTDENDGMVVSEPYDIYDQQESVSVSMVRDASAGFLDIGFNATTNSRGSSPMKIRPLKRATSSLLETGSLPDDVPMDVDDDDAVPDPDDAGLATSTLDSFPSLGSAPNSQSTLELNADLVNSFWS
eukprot:TRINITY_DN3305_c0_g2_i1.p1 TRINITY_DN3305_c0_g2~~TRINITY_DN3305_c0_g2_i1.p1  ORF type:complete len:1258 (-),score=304.88 TRINITY_DN3305_c0_g2_i1:41-3814(-)